MKTFYLLLFSLSLFFNSQTHAQSDKGKLGENTIIPVKFTNEASSENSEEIVMVVDKDINDDYGNKLIASGTKVVGTVERTPKKFAGREGGLIITFVSTTATDGQKIDLLGQHRMFGENREDIAWTCCFLSFGFGILLKGLPATIPAGTVGNYARSAATYKINSGGSGTTAQNNSEQPQYRGGGDPMKGLNVNKSAGALQIGDYYALIIGIDKYSGSWTPLRNAVGDAKAVEQLLKSEYKFDYFKTLFDDDATRKNIISQMEWLTQNVKEKDNVLIYYSGHGEYKQNLNKGYWVPFDAQTTSTSDYISNNDLQTFLSGIKSKHTLLVSDACFSGDIFRGNTLAVPFEDSERYYKEVHNLPSRQALTSGGIEPVMDGGREGHSVFAYYLLKSLMNNGSKYYDASQLYSTLKIPVTNNSEQSPQFQSIKNAGDEGGQFIFIKK